jgi:hypothetical protein
MMLTRAILLFLAMMTGLTAAQAADRSRLIASAQGLRLTAGQLLSDVQAERVERQVRMPMAILKAPLIEVHQQCDLFLSQGDPSPSIAIHLSDRPRT